MRAIPALLATVLLAAACADDAITAPPLDLRPHGLIIAPGGGEAPVLGTVEGVPASPVVVGQPVTVTTTVANTTASEGTVDWGDGSTTIVPIVDGAITGSHAFAEPGTFEIYVYVGPTYTSTSVVVADQPVEPEPVGGSGTCTRTQGYWKQKHHAWPAAYDRNAAFHTRPDSWQRVLNTPPSKGSAYHRLAHQYIAAVLNRADLATTPAHVAAAIDASRAYFDGQPSAGFDAGATAQLLDRFNNGQEGVPHCD